MTFNWFAVWLIAASSSEKIRAMSFGEFMAEVRWVPDGGAA